MASDQFYGTPEFCESVHAAESVRDSRYERGIRDIPTDILIKLAELYKTSTDYLLGLTNNTKPYDK